MVSAFERKLDPLPKAIPYTYPSLRESLVRERLVRADKDGPSVSAAEYQPGHDPGSCPWHYDKENKAVWDCPHMRSNNNVMRLHFLGLDFDNLSDDEIEGLKNRLVGVEYCLYTTHSHGAHFRATGRTKLRAIVALNRAVDPKEWRAFYVAAAARFGASLHDKSCKDLARILYLPSCPPGDEAVSWARALDGEPLNVDDILASAVDRGANIVEGNHFERQLARAGKAIRTLRREDGRHDAINRLAFRLGQLIATDDQYGVAYAALYAAATATVGRAYREPLSPERAEDDVGRGLRDGMAAGAASGTSDEWRSSLARTALGQVAATYDNGRLFLVHERQWRDVLGFDNFTREPIYLSPPPFSSDYQGADFSLRQYPSCVPVSDISRIKSWLSAQGLPLKSNEVVEALRIAAEQHVVNFVTDYLDGCVWDGVSRLDGWLFHYAGATDTPLNRAVGAKWMIQAVARVYDPGCQADAVMIFVGEQGFGKSSIWSTLVPNRAWFADQVSDLHSKDSRIGLAKKWIVELAELAALRKSDVETVKVFITERVDNYRAPYAITAEDHPRHTVFGGSTNKREFLVDRTGGRRFWPVEVAVTRKAPRLEELAEHRDQLWAEAVHRYRAGEPWWLDATQELAAQEQQESSSVGDVWDELVATWCRSPLTALEIAANIPFREGLRVVVRLADAMMGAVDLKAPDMHPAAQSRMAEALAKNGYKKVRPRVDGRKVTLYQQATATDDDIKVVADFSPPARKHFPYPFT